MMDERKETVHVDSAPPRASSGQNFLKPDKSEKQQPQHVHASWADFLALQANFVELTARVDVGRKSNPEILDIKGKGFQGASDPYEVDLAFTISARVAYQVFLAGRELTSMLTQYITINFIAIDYRYRWNIILIRVITLPNSGILGPVTLSARN